MNKGREFSHLPKDFSVSIDLKIQLKISSCFFLLLYLFIFLFFVIFSVNIRLTFRMLVVKGVYDMYGGCVSIFCGPRQKRFFLLFFLYPMKK